MFRVATIPDSVERQALAPGDHEWLVDPSIVPLVAGGFFHGTALEAQDCVVLLRNSRADLRPLALPNFQTVLVGC
jgi:hypothetical protein